MGQDFGIEWRKFFSRNFEFSGEVLLLCSPPVVGGAAKSFISGADDEPEMERGGKDEGKRG